jgi:hypothetical protein
MRQRTTAVAHCGRARVVFARQESPKAVTAQARDWVFDPKPSLRVHAERDVKRSLVAFQRGALGTRNILEHALETDLILATLEVTPVGVGSRLCPRPP